MTDDWRKDVKMESLPTSEAYRPGWDALVAENERLKAKVAVARMALYKASEIIALYAPNVDVRVDIDAVLVGLDK